MFILYIQYIYCIYTVCRQCGTFEIADRWLAVSWPLLAYFSLVLTLCNIDLFQNDDKLKKSCLLKVRGKDKGKPK